MPSVATDAGKNEHVDQMKLTRFLMMLLTAIYAPAGHQCTDFIYTYRLKHCFGLLWLLTYCTMNGTTTSGSSLNGHHPLIQTLPVCHAQSSRVRGVFASL